MNRKLSSLYPNNPKSNDDFKVSALNEEELKIIEDNLFFMDSTYNQEVKELKKPYREGLFSVDYTSTIKEYSNRLSSMDLVIKLELIELHLSTFWFDDIIYLQKKKLERLLFDTIDEQKEKENLEFQLFPLSFDDDLISITVNDQTNDNIEDTKENSFNSDPLLEFMKIKNKENILKSKEEIVKVQDESGKIFITNTLFVSPQQDSFDNQVGIYLKNIINSQFVLWISKNDQDLQRSFIKMKYMNEETNLKIDIVTKENLSSYSAQKKDLNILFCSLDIIEFLIQRNHSLIQKCEYLIYMEEILLKPDDIICKLFDRIISISQLNTKLLIYTKIPFFNYTNLKEFMKDLSIKQLICKDTIQNDNIIVDPRKSSLWKFIKNLITFGNSLLKNIPDILQNYTLTNYSENILNQKINDLTLEIRSINSNTLEFKKKKEDIKNVNRII